MCEGVKLECAPSLSTKKKKSLWQKTVSLFFLFCFPNSADLRYARDVGIAHAQNDKKRKKSQRKKKRHTQGTNQKEAWIDPSKETAHFFSASFINQRFPSNPIFLSYTPLDSLSVIRHRKDSCRGQGSSQKHRMGSQPPWRGPM